MAPRVSIRYPMCLSKGDGPYIRVKLSCSQSAYRMVKSCA
jgi:hypothetical protein